MPPPPQHIIPQAGSPADTPPYRDPYDPTISENVIYQFLFATLVDMESPIGRTEERRLSYRKKIRDIVQLSDTDYEILRTIATPCHKNLLEHYSQTEATLKHSGLSKEQRHALFAESDTFVQTTLSTAIRRLRSLLGTNFSSFDLHIRNYIVPRTKTVPVTKTNGGN